METDHFGTINACLQGHQGADDRTLASIAILSDRLERLKQSHGMFAGISFSPEVNRLSGSVLASAVS